MKSAVAALALLAVLPAEASFAHERGGVAINDIRCCDEPSRWGPRYAAHQSRFAITSRDDKVTLVLTDRVVAFQLSDRVMRKLDRDLRRERQEDDDDGPIGEAIKVAVIGVVRSMLDHSAECPVRELRDVRYEDDRLVFVTREGDRAFDRFEVDDEDVLESFDPRDAREFVRQFHRLKASAR